MKKKNIYKLLFAVSAVLVLGFAIRFGVDAYKYDSYMGSAPLYAYALIRFAEFIVPSMIVFVVAIFVKKKHKKDDEK